MSVRPQFIFGRGTGAESPEELARLRAVARALGQPAAPRNAWEGLSALGDALGYRMTEGKADRMEEAGRESASGAVAKALGGFGGTGATSASPTSAPSGDGSYRDAIASIESAGSGDYSAVGPTHPKMGRALGRYQVMEANIGPWSKEVLGQEITPEQFLADPKLQDSIFDGKFGGYVKQFGSPEAAAQAWFGGPGGVGQTDRKDVLGTSVGGYGQKFMKALGGPQQVASLDPSIGMPQEQPSVAAALQGPQAAQNNPGNIGMPDGSVAQGAFPPPPPVQTAQAGPDLNTLLEAAKNPWLNDQERALVNMLLEQKMQQQDPANQMELEKSRLELEALKNPVEKPTADIQEYEYAKQRGYEGDFVQFQLDQKKAGATSVTTNVGAGDKFYEELDKAQAGIFSGLSEAGVQGRAKSAQIDRLEGLLASSQTGGLAAIKQLAGEYGIPTEGLDDIQATQALINELVPQQRQPGSGPMSDADLALFKQSLPRLINQPGGNQTIIETMRGITQYQVQMGQIADAVADRTMKPEEARKAIRELQNPLAGFGKTEKSGLPEGVSEEDIEHTMKLHGVTREEVLKRLGNAP